MLPELRDVLPDVAAGPRVERGTVSAVRCVFLVPASRRLGAAAAIGLDDVHAADASSVLLMRFVAEAIAGAPVLIVGCYRDTEVGPDLARRYRT